MLDEDSTPTHTQPQQPQLQQHSADAPTAPSRPRRRAAGRPAGPPAPVSGDIFAVPGAQVPPPPPPPPVEQTEPDTAVATAAIDESEQLLLDDVLESDDDASLVAEDIDAFDDDVDVSAVSPGIGGLIFQAPPAGLAPPRRRPAGIDDDEAFDDDEPLDSEDAEEENDDADGDDDADSAQNRRRRRSRGGRRRRNKTGGSQNSDDSGEDDSAGDADGDDSDVDDASDDDHEDNASSTSRRRRSRRRAGDHQNSAPDDPENTVVKVREGRSAEDEITSVTGSTRLEAKKQRRREGREAGRRRAPIVSEAEFLARREAVDRQMIVRQHDGTGETRGSSDTYTQIAVLEDKVLVEHYVARSSQTSLIGNVYIGKVQNVLPSMEAAFVDIGAGRNAVLYAGEVDWSSLPDGKDRKIEEALSPGQTVLVQVTKDPIGQKGARLTSQVSLPGRYLVYVPGGHNSGISRKLPDTERARLKNLLKDIVPEDAGVIVRTAAEGATEDQLTRDVTSLKARWEDIERKVVAGRAPELLYAEPDLVIKVVRDLFNEDFSALVVEGREAWDNIAGYIGHVAPDLTDRLHQWEPSEHAASDVFAEYRVDEQIVKALDRKVWLPSGGSLIIDRTEAMTVVDVNTGKFTGNGGNLEETVTKNNLEAAEEIVRQLRLRDIGGIIVIDFIDMVLESNRDLVLRRLVECLGRDRTRHQVAEVTSLGLVQMTRKRIGTGLVESFSTECDHCKGRGVVIHAEPIEPKKDEGGSGGGSRRNRGRGGRGGRGNGNNGSATNQNQNQGGSNEESSTGQDQPKAENTGEKESPAQQSQAPETRSETSDTPPVPAPVLTDEGQAP